MSSTEHSRTQTVESAESNVRLFENRAKINDWIAGGLGLAGAATWFQPDVAGSDLWWHLASGRQIWSEHRIPEVDDFSFTFQGHEWMNHEWLWDALYWPVYSLHPQLVFVLNFGVLLAIFACAGRLARRAGCSAWATALTLWAAAACTHWFLDIRPHLVTLLYLQLFLLFRNRPWAPWTWPLLMLVWVNTHGGFVFGLGAIGLHAVVATLQRRWGFASPIDLRRAWIGVAASMLAMLANPWGWRILEYPLAYLPGVSDSPYQNLVEWKPPGLEVLQYQGAYWFLTFQARFWLLVVLAAGGIALRARRDPYLAALSLVTLVMATNARRFIPLFVVCSVPWIGLCLQQLATFAAGILPALRGVVGARLRAAGAVGAAVAVVVLWTQVQLWPDPLGRWTQRDLYPDAAIQYLRSVGRPLRILNHYNWGGYVMLHLPGVRVFMDGRANTLYDTRIYEDWRTFQSAGPGLRTRLSRYSADVALLPDQAFARALTQLPRPWRIVYRDPVAVILLPPDSTLRLPSFDVVTEHPQFMQQRARAMMRSGQLRRAEELLREVLRRDPLLLNTYGDLAALEASQGDVAGIEAVLEEARRAGRRRPQNLSVLIGFFHAQTGDVARAMQDFRRGIPRGPFEDPTPVLARLRAIDREPGKSPKPAG
jgi:hypothetical protein